MNKMLNCRAAADKPPVRFPFALEKGSCPGRERKMRRSESSRLKGISHDQVKSSPTHLSMKLMKRSIFLIKKV